jgi:hypothetical protein
MISVNIDSSGWRQHEKKLKQTIKTNIQDYLQGSVLATWRYAQRITPVGRPITPDGDRPRPGHTYGDLRKGWIHLKLKSNNKDDVRSYETGITHDAFGKKSTGSVILKVLESGAAPHTYRSRDYPFGVMTFYLDSAFGVVQLDTVNHPGYHGIQLLSRVRQYAYEDMVERERLLVHGVE